MTDSDGKHVFISYVREDSDRVDLLCGTLEAAQLPYWRDRSALGPGDAWRAKIRQAIREGSLVFLACFSDNSRAKGNSYMNEELTLAVEEYRQMPLGRTWLIPVRFDSGDVPYWDLGAGRVLSDLNYSDLFGVKHVENAVRLVTTIKLLTGEKRPDPATALTAVEQATSADRTDLLSRLPKEMSRDPARRIELDDSSQDVDRQAAPGRRATVPRSTRIRSIFVLGGVTGQTKHKRYERVELERFCNRLGAAVAAAGVDLVVCSPFTESADVHALLGYVDSQTDGIVHMHRPRRMHLPGTPSLDQQMRELRDLIGPAAMDRIQQWYYPEPETQDPDAIGQAWLLCQLIAIEHADAIAAIGGKPDKTANTILRLAEARRQPIVPFTFLGGAAELAYMRRDWQQIYPWFDATKLADKNAVADVIEIANQMVTGRLRETGPTGPPGQVFISRARDDNNYAVPMSNYLSKAGLTVLLGERGLPDHRMVEAAIADSVLRSDLFIALWSRRYAASRYCYDEIDLALRRYRAGESRLWIINLDGSNIVPPGARGLPQVQARTPQEVVDVVRDLLAEAPRPLMGQG